MTKTTEPITAEVVPYGGDYPVLHPGEMAQTMRLLTDTRRFDVLRIPRIRASKSGFFEVEGPDGVANERALEGLIIASRESRLYWGRAYNALAKSPPSCTSNDGFTGAGDPGGECSKCPYSKFKSARNPDGSQAQGQACKELRQALFLLPGYSMPHRLDIQPTSIQAFDKYTLNLLWAKQPYWGVITKLGIEIIPASGYPVARVTFQRKERLGPDQLRLLEPYHERMRDLLTPMTIESDAYEVFEPEQPRRAFNQPGGNPDEIPF